MRAAGLCACAAVALVLSGCVAALPEPSPSATTASPVATAVVSSDVPYGSFDGVPLNLDTCIPDTAESALPVVVLVHGGGFVGGVKGDLATICIGLAEAGFAVFNIDYSLAPAAVFPTQVQQLGQAIDWIASDLQVSGYGIDPSRLAVVGASAGAILAAEVGYGVDASTVDTARVSGVVLLSGVYEWERSFAGFGDELQPVVLDYLGCSGVAGCDLGPASPIEAVSSGDPETLIVHARAEFVPVDQANLLADALTDAGVPHDLMIVSGSDHAETLLFRHPAVMARVVEFLRSVLEPSR